MKLTEVARLIELAIDRKPPKIITTIAGDYYQPYYHLMYLLATRIKYGEAIELGVEKGRGVLSMAAGCSDCQVIGLDNNESVLSNPDFHKHDFQEFASLELYNLPSLPVPDFIRDNGCHIALLHIDTEHSYSMANAEFEAYKPYLQPGAVVLFDDLHAQENDVLRYFSELPYPKIQDDRLHPVNGYGVMLYV